MRISRNVLFSLAISLTALLFTGCSNSEVAPKTTTTPQRTASITPIISPIVSPTKGVKSLIGSPTAISKLTEAPAGYSWKYCLTSGSRFLLPDGWFFKEESNESGIACFISKESIELEKEYKTGFSINIVQDIPGKQGQSALEYVKGLTQAAQSKYSTSAPTKIDSQGSPFSGYSLYINDQQIQEGPITVYDLFMANDAKGTIFIITYEAPKSSWDEAWKIGQVILGKMVLNAEY
ncbi:MAG: hypothetical protein WCP97_03870 [bacterium]